MPLFPVLREWLGGEKTPEPAPSMGVAVRDDGFLFQGMKYDVFGNTSYGTSRAEPISDDFEVLVQAALFQDSVVSALESTRFMVFAEARFLFQRLVQGRPGELWGDGSLSILESPWPGGTTGDLLARMQLHADFAGNAYVIRPRPNELAMLRPDWVEMALAARYLPTGERVGYERVGYNYYEGGINSGVKPVFFLPGEVAHYAPYPDPLAMYRGMSWLTPVAREIQSDRMMTEHKVKFFENAATPNIHVGLKEMTPAKFAEFVDAMEEQHKGVANAYKTLYTANGADVTVLGTNFQQMDFKAVQGAAETRIAAAAGVHPVIAGLSEGMQGSSLNAGNYQAAKRVFVDKTLRPLWRNVAGSLQTLISPPSGSRLWFDDRDIAFLREDVKDRADVQQTQAITIRNLVDAGYEPTSVVDAVKNEDMTLLKHSGLFSVQLQEAGSTPPTPEPARTEVTIAEGAIRNEIPVDVDARIMPGAVDVRTNDPVESQQAAADAVTGVLESVVPELLAEERLTREAQLSAFTARHEEASSALVASLDEWRTEQARPRRTVKTVHTDDIGRITAVVEEQE